MTNGSEDGSGGAHRPPDPVHGDGYTNYERLLREVAPLMHAYEAQLDDYANDGSAALIYARYQRREGVGAMDAHDAVSWALWELTRLRERLLVLESAERARGAGDRQAS